MRLSQRVMKSIAVAATAICGWLGLVLAGSLGERAAVVVLASITAPVLAAGIGAANKALAVLSDARKATNALGVVDQEVVHRS